MYCGLTGNSKSDTDSDEGDDTYDDTRTDTIDVQWREWWWWIFGFLINIAENLLILVHLMAGSTLGGSLVLETGASYAGLTLGGSLVLETGASYMQVYTVHKQWLQLIMIMTTQ